MKEAERRWNETSERLRFSTEYAQSGLKGLFLANGAAIVGLLTFVGNAKVVVEPVALWWSFVWFSLGLTCVLGAYLAAYWSQELLMNASFGEFCKAESAAYETGQVYNFTRYEKNGQRAVKVGLSLAIVALVFFVAGAFVALNAIT